VARTPQAEARPLGGSTADYAAWLDGNIAVVDRLARATAQRAHLSSAEIDDFLSDVHLKLVAEEFAVLKSFQGRGRVTTFLLTVLQRAALDFRNSRWGRWRASAEALRLGAIAVKLEELVYRDGLSFDEVCGTLHAEGETESRDRLYEMLLRLPVRPRPDRFGVTQQRDRMADPETPESQATTAEASARAKRLQTALKRACESLSTQDRLALRLRFHGGLALATIARALHVHEKQIYRRFEHALADVRKALEAEGFTADDALAVVHGFDLDGVLPAAATETASDSRAS
jgi:RNA polymerase sigma factor (sigma-70 family)